MIPSSTAVLRTALSSRYAFATDVGLAPVSSCAALRAGPQLSVDGRAHRTVFGLEEKARLRPDPAKLVISVGRVLARRAVVVALPEEIDLTNAAGVAEQLTLADHHPIVIIDMSATRFCDCAGARAIVLAHKRAAEGGAELRLVVTADPTRHILGRLGVDRLLDLYPSVEAAHGRDARTGGRCAAPDGRGPGGHDPRQTQITAEQEKQCRG